MLHTIDAQGNIQWHCHSMPECSFHNCQAWDREDTCNFHLNQHNEPAGQTHTINFNDSAVKWTSPQVIELPMCSECGEIMGLQVHSDEELIEPIITKDEMTGKILQVSPHPHPKFSGNLWYKDADIVKKVVPHPTIAYLKPDEIEHLVAHLRSALPGVSTEWMQQEILVEDIHSVYPHPAVARHRSLAEQLNAAGKVYEPPKEVAPEPPVFTLSQVRNLITAALQEHGLITLPRLPAVNPPTP